jgi:hypothetical protein
MTREIDGQGSFFDEGERRAREYDKFKKRMEKAFGLAFSQINPQEMRQFDHEVNEDERSQEEEEERERKAEETKKTNAENLRLIQEAQERLDKLEEEGKEK